MDRYLKEFTAITRELLDSQQVRSMGLWRHHGPVTCLDHSLFVAYWTYRAARFLRLDIRAATRGALLHDLYLYDPRDKSAHPGNQCLDHPRAAARNAAGLTDLDVIFYKNGRHEILNETNRLDVYGDISRWLTRHLAQASDDAQETAKEEPHADSDP